MKDSTISVDIGQRSCLSATVGFLKMTPSFGDVKEGFGRYGRLCIDWDVDRVFVAAKMLFEVAASRGRVKPDKADIAYLVSTTDYQELEFELQAIWFYINLVLEQAGIEGWSLDTIEHLLSRSVLGSVDESLDDNLFFKIGAFAHSRMPIYVSYSSLVRNFRIIFNRSSRLLTLIRR